MKINIKDPKTQKMFGVGFGVAAVLYLYFFASFVPFGHRAMSADKEKLEQEYRQLSSDLSNARQSLNNLAEVERQYELITRRWDVASELLPEKREVATLLRKVTLVGQQAGVEFELFKPMPQVPGEIYDETPVQVQVVGGYHEVGSFLAEVANLDRIINVTGLKLLTLEEGKGRKTVTASFTATAYMLNPAGKAQAKGENNAG
jgi:type IV pilus assembly protein PilO